VLFRGDFAKKNAAPYLCSKVAWFEKLYKHHAIGYTGACAQSAGMGEIDVTEFYSFMSTAAKDFVERQLVYDDAELMVLMGERNSVFWIALHEEFGETQGQQAAGIVCEMFGRLAFDKREQYDACSRILVAAIEHRASFMVLKVIVDLCPYAVRYRHTERNMTIVHIALLYRHSIEVIRLLSRCGDKVIQIMDCNGLTVLHYAAMYNAPLDVVEYVYGLDPMLVEFRSCNQHTIEEQTAQIGVCQSDGCPLFFNRGEVSTCPATSTPLCVALFQNRMKLSSYDNSAVVEFLNRKSATVRLVPAYNNELPFMMLLEGHYSPENFEKLLVAFCKTHAEHGRMVAFCLNDRREMLLQIAARIALNNDCVDILCDFTIAQFHALNTTVLALYCGVVCNDRERMGVKFQSDNVSFDVRGVIQNTDRTVTPSLVPAELAGTRLVAEYMLVIRTVLLYEESTSYCCNMAKWINPLYRDEHKSDAEVLQGLQQSLLQWFEKQERVSSRYKGQSTCLHRIVSHLQNDVARHYAELKTAASEASKAAAIKRSETEAEEEKRATNCMNDLIAELAAEAAASKAKKPSKSRKLKKILLPKDNIDKGNSLAEQPYRVTGSSMSAHDRQLVSQQQREEEYWAHANHRKNESGNSEVQEAGMDIPVSPVNQSTRAQSDLERKNARARIAAQDAILEQAQLSRMLLESQLAVQSNAEEDTGRAASSRFMAQRHQQVQQPKTAKTLPSLPISESALTDNGSNPDLRQASRPKRRGSARKPKINPVKVEDTMEPLTAVALQDDFAQEHALENMDSGAGKDDELDAFETAMLDLWLETPHVDDIRMAHVEDVLHKVEKAACTVAKQRKEFDKTMSDSGWRVDDSLAARFQAQKQRDEVKMGTPPMEIFDEIDDLGAETCLFCYENAMTYCCDSCGFGCCCTQCVPAVRASILKRDMRCLQCNHILSKIRPITI